MGIQPGDVLDGKYELERLLGRGGMGAVYLALHRQLERRVAVKVLLPDGTRNPEAVARFHREARAAAGLHSEHVARVLDTGQLEGGEPYLVMEFLDGEDLAAALAHRGRLPVVEVVAIALQILEAIGEAHANGIVHRDLKPANIFLARRPNGMVTAKVLDFGISKAPGGTGSVALTSSVALMGSPRYMAPEQVRESRNVDPRADIWALGVTLYELVSGEAPFRAETLGEICAEILVSEPRPLREVCPEAPAALEAIVARCLRKEMAQRFSSAEELAGALRSALEPAQGAAGTLSASAAAQAAGLSGTRTFAADHSPSTTTAHPMAISHQGPNAERPRRTWLAGVGVVLVIVAAIAAVARYSRSAPPGAVAAAVVDQAPQPPAATSPPPAFTAPSSPLAAASPPPAFVAPPSPPAPPSPAPHASDRATVAASSGDPAFHAPPIVHKPRPLPGTSAPAPVGRPADTPATPAATSTNPLDLQYK